MMFRITVMTVMKYKETGSEHFEAFWVWEKSDLELQSQLNSVQFQMLVVMRD